MPIYKIKLLARKKIAKNTIQFIWEKPTGFTFVPGQYGGFTLLHPAGQTRRFSLLSIPDDDTIAFATRIQNSIYKETLQGLALGSEIKLAGPSGTFTLHNDINIPSVFIAGGIGIAPFYSMLRHALKHQPNRQILLFYGNQSTQETAFLAELFAYEKQYPSFKLIATITNADTDWTGEVGFIDDALLIKHIKDLFAPIYYICGSPNMVNALKATLRSLDISEEQIRWEDFPGY